MTAAPSLLLEKVVSLVAAAGIPGGTDVIVSRHPSADDAAWFSQHPARTHRVRKTTAEEHHEYEGAGLMIVRQVEPTWRLRFGVPEYRTDPPFHEWLARNGHESEQFHDAFLAELLEILLIGGPLFGALLDKVADRVRVRQAAAPAAPH